MKKKLSPEQLQMLLKELATQKAMMERNPELAKKSGMEAIAKIKGAASEQPEDLVEAKRAISNQKPRPQLKLVKSELPGDATEIMSEARRTRVLPSELTNQLMQEKSGQMKQGTNTLDPLEDFLSKRGTNIEPSIKPSTLSGMKPQAAIGVADEGAAAVAQALSSDAAESGVGKMLTGAMKNVKIPGALLGGAAGLGAEILFPEELGPSEGSDESIVEDPTKDYDVRKEALKRIRLKAGRK